MAWEGDGREGRRVYTSRTSSSCERPPLRAPPPTPRIFSFFAARTGSRTQAIRGRVETSYPPYCAQHRTGGCG